MLSRPGEKQVVLSRSSRHSWQPPECRPRFPAHTPAPARQLVALCKPAPHSLSEVQALLLVLFSVGGFSEKQAEAPGVEGSLLLRSCGSRSGQDEGRVCALPPPDTSSQAQTAQLSSRGVRMELFLSDFSVRHLLFKGTVLASNPPRINEEGNKESEYFLKYSCLV